LRPLRQDDAVFEALGAVDELAAFVGQAREECLLQVTRKQGHG
jgi:cob(I)alamin adenosyltransferase